jgi:hypothetical protein
MRAKRYLQKATQSYNFHFNKANQEQIDANFTVRLEFDKNEFDGISCAAT